VAIEKVISGQQQTLLFSITRFSIEQPTTDKTAYLCLHKPPRFPYPNGESDKQSLRKKLTQEIFYEKTIRNYAIDDSFDRLHFRATWHGRRGIDWARLNGIWITLWSSTLT